MTKLKTRLFLPAPTIHKFLTQDDEALDTAIMTSENYEFYSTDQALYMAVGAIEDRDEISYNKLVKLLEVCALASHAKALNEPRRVLTHAEAAAIRKKSAGKPEFFQGSPQGRKDRTDTSYIG